MPEHQLIDEVMTLVLAGHETTAIVLTWAWCLLAGHPSAEALLQAELDEVLGGRLPTVSDLPRLRFTRMVVLETLRLFPPSWLLERQAIQPVEVAGRRLRKGTTVMMSQWVMHRDPRFFEQPDQFQPGRWADGLEQRLPRFAYFPFGGGPRICIGSGFAMQEAMLVLATINQRYSMTLTPGQTVEPWPTVTLRPRTGVQMEVRLRAPAQPAPALG
jgi:cytochrome P450